VLWKDKVTHCLCCCHHGATIARVPAVHCHLSSHCRCFTFCCRCFTLCCRVEWNELQQVESRRDGIAEAERTRRTTQTETRTGAGETQEKTQH